jgi:transposase
MSGKRREFDRNFKLSAVRLFESSDEPLEQVARRLGICGSMLRRWRSQVKSHGAEAFSEGGRMERSELTRLMRENKELRRDLEALKKTLDYLGQTAKRGTKR